MVFSFLLCHTSCFGLQLCCFLGIDWSWPVRFFSFLCGISRTHLFSLLDSRKKTAMILQWVSSLPPDLLLVFATTLGVSDLAELNKTISSANVSSIVDRFLYFNDASVPVSCLLIGSLKQRRRIFAWFFFGFPFGGAVSYFGFI